MKLRAEGGVRKMRGEGGEGETEETKAMREIG